MSAHLERASALLSHDRYEQAETEARQAVGQDPDDPQGHAMLAVALVNQEGDAKKRDAVYEAQMAVHLAPGWPWAQYILAYVYRDTGKLRDAEAAVKESVRLDASDADAWGLWASLAFAQSRWAEARDLAERGLTVSPDHVGCANLRAMALTKLKQPDQAQSALLSALAKEPENPLTHATRGWGLLEANKPKEAMAHFQEALRLDPESDWAMRGIVEALQARNPLYRLLLQYFFWMGRLSPRIQWVVIVGLYFGSQAVSSVRHNNPALAPYLLPVSIAYTLFVFFTWMARPISNLLLRLHPLGKLVLNRAQIATSNAVGACLGVAVLALAAGLITKQAPFLPFAACAAIMTLPVSGIWTARKGTAQIVLVSLCGTLALLALLTLADGYATPRTAANGGAFFGLFLLLIFGYTWTASLFQRK